MAPHGHIILPLKAKGRVLGVLYLYLPEHAPIIPNANHVLRSIANQIGMAIHNAQLYQETKECSLHDPLTGLANRRLMEIDLDRNLARTRRLDAPLSVIIADLDHFKDYNDERGHIAGDKALVDVARVIAEESREMDLAVRYGGEEFCILLPNTDLKKAAGVAERIRKTVAVKTDITISLGVSSFHSGIEDGKELIAQADKSLYEAKRKGRNQVVISDAG